MTFVNRVGLDIKALKEIQHILDEMRELEISRDIYQGNGFREDIYNSLQATYTRLTQRYPMESLAASKARPISEQIKAFGSLARHDFPVLDYKPASGVTHIRNWLDMVDASRDEEIDIVMTPYYVGCRVELVYQGGSLHKAITKGGGIMGTDFTLNAYLIEGIPQQINDPERISVRGVITFNRVVSPGTDIRRVVAGAMLSDAATNINLTNLVFIADDWHIPGTTFSSKDLRSISLTWGMLDNYSDTFPGQFKETGYLEETIEEFKLAVKTELPMLGILFTVNPLQRKMDLGYTSVHPEWAILLQENISNEQPVDV